MRLLSTIVLGLSASICSAGAVPGGTVEIFPTKDATLYEDSAGGLANGAGQHLFAGITFQGGSQNERRALIEYDIAGNVPAGATITGVEFRISVDRSSQTPTRDYFIHRVTQEWAEGADDAPGAEGGGTTATAGSATWIDAVSPGAAWASPGGDFDAMASATITLGEEGVYFLPGVAGLVPDVQAWLDDDSSNHGWIILGENLGDFVATVKRFASRENMEPTSLNPSIVVTYELGTSVCLGDCNDDGDVNFSDLVAMLGEFGGAGSNPGCDADESGSVNFSDLVATLGLFGPCP